LEAKSKFKAVLFDFDGTLAATMEDNFNAWKCALAEYGVEIKPDDYYPVEGLRVLEVPKHLFKRHGKKAPDAKEVAEKKEHYYKKNHNFALYPGVTDLLDAFNDKNIPLAVVTAGQLERLRYSTPNGFLDKFKTVITGEDTKHGKPAPDPYLKGAEALGVRPQECVVVENAPLGIRSAKKAGTYCIALSTTVKKQLLEEADEVLSAFSDLTHSEPIRALLNRTDVAEAKHD
jgi:beta-phosphoglucomutase